MIGDIKNYDNEDLRNILRGVRYELGLSLPKIGKVGFDKGLFGNWECGICKPNKENTKKLIEIIENTKKTEKELINLGKSNIGDIIEETSKISNIPIELLIRFILKRATTIQSISCFHKIKSGKVNISAKNKKIIIKINELVKKHKGKDPRNLLKIIQKEIFDGTKEKRFSKINWNVYRKYNEVISMELRKNKFEGKVYDLIKNMSKDTLRNTVISDKNFKYITEVDLCSKINNKTVIFLCSNTNYRHLINKKWEVIKKIENINKHIKPNFIFIVSSCRVINKDVFCKKNVGIIDLEDIKKLKKKTTHILDISNKKEIYNNKIKTIRGKDIVNILKSKKLSIYQLATLIDMNGEYLTKVVREDKILTKKLKIKLGKFLEKNKLNIELHKVANLNTRLNKKAFTIKYIRERLGLKLNELSKVLNEIPQNLGNVERGLKKDNRIINKIENYLKSFKNFKKYLVEASYEHEKIKKIVSSRNFKHLVALRTNNNKGKKLENKVYKKLIKMGFVVLKNAVIADKDVKFKKEVDLYTIINNKETIIECSTSKISRKYQDLASLFVEYKNLGIERTIYINPKLTKKAIEVLSNNEIIAIKPLELGRCLDGTTNWS